ncbi:hypothetical protein AKJ65_04030 [candidate division MSBL1 archaeon SCGC-AAA259E19]|uniref:Methyltransferase type 11 domain-containing protein n=1 Tax=candidate division MSBL1 archaeon SCGC-AAA259E19 TaxID=1698264 RepID=A0A133UK46_9EURY|nr:hypothetical protein AKJ65_04030 [candidate division MSBL1 archaeon SCGC-AAA259E19]
MDSKMIKQLHCPLCGSRLEINRIIRKTDEDIEGAVVSCSCRKYPLLEGILILKSNKHLSHITKKLEEGNYTRALRSLIQSQGLANTHWISRSNPLLVNIVHRNLAGLRKLLSNYKTWRLIQNSDISFCALMRKLGWGEFGEYLINRFSDPTFWSIYPLLRVIKSRKLERVLDFGCGAGHLSFILSRAFPHVEVFNIDKSFVLLILAKRYFNDGGQYICMDFDDMGSLPFQDDYFFTVLCMDTFHYVSSKLSLANEFSRVLKSRGLTLIPHLHNALAKNISPGSPLTPAGYLKLFENSETRLFPEVNLLEEFLKKNKLDLNKKYSQERLNSAKAFVLVRSNSKVYKKYLDVDCEFLSLKSDLNINPIFEVKKANSQFILTKQDYEDKYSIVKKHVPSKLEISKEILNRIREKGRKKTSEEIQKLRRKFVLISVPRNYCSFHRQIQT